MLILFDHGTPAPLRPFLQGHTVRQAKAHGWDRLTNGNLLDMAGKDAAGKAGFDRLVTSDKNMRYQQNLMGRKIAIVVLGNSQWPVLRLHMQLVVAAGNVACTLKKEAPCYGKSGLVAMPRCGEYPRQG